jgi:hypothetical protein
MASNGSSEVSRMNQQPEEVFTTVEETLRRTRDAIRSSRELLNSTNRTSETIATREEFGGGAIQALNSNHATLFSIVSEPSLARAVAGTLTVIDVPCSSD